MSYQGTSSGAESGWAKSIQTGFSSSWLVFLTAVIGIAFVALVICGIVLFLSYGFSASPPHSLTTRSIPSPAQITWSENGNATIQADDLESAFTALGVVHASQNTWQMTLWRQTATGMLTQWFGSDLLHLDQFSRRLQFASLAQTTYAELPTEHIRLLEAYAEGVNSVLLRRKNISQDEFALLNINPAPWEPWHSLAVERLFAWLSVRLPESDSLVYQMQDAYWPVVQSSDFDLRLWLQIHSFDHSIAGMWPADTSGNTIIYHRLVYGSSALPAFRQISLQLKPEKTVHATSIPGTLSLISGQSTSSSWYVLPTSTVRIDELPEAIEPQISHERIVNRDNSEELITLRTTPGWLLPDNEIAHDSIAVLFWPGLEKGTDLQAFLNLLSGAPPSFNLLDGNGLLTKDATWTLLGSPPEVHSFHDGLLIGASEWTYYQASRINQILQAPIPASPDHWPKDCVNTWADEKARFLVNDYLLRRSPPLKPSYKDALTYLRNWDYAYDKSSIGATIFESWLRTLPDSLYQQVVSQTLSPANPLPAKLWHQSVDTLVSKYGRDLSKWRLEDTNPIYRWYPAWFTHPHLEHPDIHLANTVFYPLNFPGQGDAATLCWGSFTSDQGLTVSARWDSWSVTSPISYSYFWRTHPVPRSLLGRYRIANEPSAIYSFASSSDNVKSVTSITRSSND